MREDEVRALEELERAWGLSQSPSVVCPACGAQSCHPKDVEYGYCARCHKFHDDMVWTPDDGAAPPNFLLVEKTESEEYGVPSQPNWMRQVQEQLPPLFARDTPWLTALVCLVASLATAAVLVTVLGR